MDDDGQGKLDRIDVYSNNHRSPDAHSDRDALDALRPEMLVQTGVDANVLRLHLLLGEIADRLFAGREGAEEEVEEEDEGRSGGRGRSGGGSGQGGRGNT